MALILNSVPVHEHNHFKILILFKAGLNKERMIYAYIPLKIDI